MGIRFNVVADINFKDIWLIKYLWIWESCYWIFNAMWDFMIYDLIDCIGADDGMVWLMSYRQQTLTWSGFEFTDV